MRKDGARIPVLLTVSPLRNREGQIVGASAIARDITAQRRSEEAVRRSEKLATAGRLAASIAHEINNPLEAVLNLIYLARNDPRQADQYLSMAEEEVGRVAHLAQQALGFVRDTASPGGIDAARVMDEVLQLYSHKLDSKQIRVTRRYRGSAQIVGFAGEVRQLLTNLLVNALDAMDRNGALHVRIRATRRWSDGLEGVYITLADNGSGIPQQSLRRIFEPFYRSASVRAAQIHGTGLGLPLAKSIAEAMGGMLTVESKLGAGSVFTLHLPCVREAHRPALARTSGRDVEIPQ